MIQICQDLLHSTHTPDHSLRRSNQICRATDLSVSSASVRSRSPVTLRPLLSQRHEKSSASPYTPPKWSPRRKHSDKLSCSRQSPRLPPNRLSPISTTSGFQTQRNYSPVLVFISPSRDHAYVAQPSSNTPSSEVMKKKKCEESSLGTNTTSLQNSTSYVSKDTLKRPVRQVHRFPGAYLEWCYYCSSACSYSTNQTQP